MTGTKMSGTYPLSYPFGWPWIFKAIPNFRPTRIAMLRATRMDELLQILEQTRALLG